MGQKRFLKLLGIIVAVVVFAGCSASDKSEDSRYADAIMVYCGAGMRLPMEEIAQAFEDGYGTQVQLNYGGSNNLLSQMELTRKGDAYMPGDAAYLQTAKDKGLASDGQIIAYHIPVIIVPKGNPAGIVDLEDLAKPGIELVWGDPEVAAIGKTGKKILEKNGLYESVWANVIATTPTMNEVMTYISLGQADASINWWDIVKSVDKIEVIEIPNQQNIISTIPIGTTTFSEHPETARAFVDFCDSVEGKAIFERHGFTIYPDPRYEE